MKATLESFGFALEGNSVDAIWETVNKLRRGEYEEHRKFCPRAPELAALTRDEQKRLDAINRKPALPRPEISSPWIDWGQRQRARTEELAAQGFVCLAENIDGPDMVRRIARKQFPAGTIWFWHIQEAWGPQNAN